MSAFILRRLLFLVFVLIGVSLLIFGIMMTFSPERRAAVFVNTPQQAEDIPNLIQLYGLNDPIYIQYSRWLKSFLTGHMGWSHVASMPVSEAFFNYFPITLELNLFAIPLTILIGIWLGTIAGINQNRIIDHAVRLVSIIGWSLPTFLFALVLLLIFYGYFNIFPPGILSDQNNLMIINSPDEFVRYTGMYVIDGLINGNWTIVRDALYHLILPIITQVVVVVALLMRIMRSGMIEELSKDYILTARAKGLPLNRVYLIHARKNALIPVFTIAGQMTALSLEGSIAVEVIFNRQGMGWWLAESATQLDMPVLMSMCMFMGFVFVLSNFIVDILYAWIDPRIRYH